VFERYENRLSSDSHPTIFVDVCKILNSFDIKMSSSHLGNKNAKGRVKEFPQDLHADHGILLCHACEKALYDRRKSTVTDHLSSYKHVKKKRA
jgi:hypothetical protein